MTTEYITEYVYPELNPPPVREEWPEQGELTNTQYLTLIIADYEELVSDWESWAIQVYENNNQALPDSLIFDN